MLMITVRAPLELVIRRLLTVEIGFIGNKHHLIRFISEQLSCNDCLMMSENSISSNVLKAKILGYELRLQRHSCLMDDPRYSSLALQLEKTSENAVA